MAIGSKHQYKYDYYISYAEDGRAWVLGDLLPKLRRSGVSVLIDEDFLLGQPILRERERAIQNSWRTLVILTPMYLGDQKKELIRFMGFTRPHTTKDHEYPVIPIILEDIERGLLLNVVQAIDLSNKDDRDYELEKLLSNQGVILLDNSKKKDCPYLGMSAFQEKDSDKFYGRENEILKYTDHLNENRFLVLTGVSGCGKSSLVNAGIIPLFKSRLKIKNIIIKKIRPSQYVNIIHTHKKSVSFIPDIDSKDNNYLIFVDQFEEFFSNIEYYNENKLTSMGELFISELSILSKKSYIVITVRDDFYPQLGIFEKWLSFDPHIFRIGFIGLSGLKDIIIKPAEKLGVYLDNVLVERLINDSGTDPGILPFIQETMRHLWSRMTEQYIDVKDYEKLEGFGVSGLKYAIALKADSAFNALPKKRDKLIAKVLFIKLINFDRKHKYTRRQLTRSKIKISKKYEKNLNMVLNHFSNKKYRLIVLGKDESKNPTVDIIHESLIFAWRNLQDWILQFKADELKIRSLEDKYYQWIEYGGGDLGLLTNHEIERIYVNLKTHHKFTLNENILGYIKRSKDKNKKNRLKNLIKAISYITLPFLFLFISIKTYNYYLLFLAKKTSGKLSSYTNYIHPFSIEKYEVSNYLYCLCQRTSYCNEHNYGIYNVCDNEISQKPVTNINLANANLYCKWMNRRLPRNDEWDHAANNFVYKKKNTHKGVKPSRLNKNTKENVKNIPNDITADGVYGLLGNVSEWTVSYFDKCNDKKIWDNSIDCMNTKVITKGGNYLQSNSYSLLHHKNPTNPNKGYDYIGFRCAK